MFKPISAPMPRHRLFFALFPPPLVARRIAHWAERYGPHAAFVRADRLHVTLDILDDHEAFPRDIAERLIEVGASIAADPFMIELDQVSCGGGTIALRPRLKNQGLQRLAGAYRQCAGGRRHCRASGTSLQPAPHLAVSRGPAVQRDRDAVRVAGDGIHARSQPARPYASCAAGVMAADRRKSGSICLVVTCRTDCSEGHCGARSPLLEARACQRPGCRGPSRCAVVAELVDAQR